MNLMNKIMNVGQLFSEIIIPICSYTVFVSVEYYWLYKGIVKVMYFTFNFLNVLSKCLDRRKQNHISIKTAQKTTTFKVSAFFLPT